MTGGPLGSDEYELTQFHFHWGSCNKQGSEHRVDGRQFPAEMHLVHYNRSQYSSIEEAAMCPMGLAVISVLIDEDAEIHSEFAKIEAHIPLLRFKGKGRRH